MQRDTGIEVISASKKKALLKISVISMAILVVVTVIPIGILADETTEAQSVTGPMNGTTSSNTTEDKDNETQSAAMNNDGNNSGSHGSVYVRWGREDCPDTAELVYTGFIGGAFFAHTGSASEFRCLPEFPIYDEPVASDDSTLGRGLLYGAEYQIENFPQWESLNDHSPVCAVCLVRTRGVVLMVPARNDCPSDEWTREYYGYLMSERHTHAHAGEFICVDKNPQAQRGSAMNVNGATMYLVEGRCGAMPCNPYQDFYELTCAVCTI